MNSVWPICRKNCAASIRKQRLISKIVDGLCAQLRFVCLVGNPHRDQRGRLGTQARHPPPQAVFVFREREDLYQRINHRVEKMFENGVIEEVRATGAMSETASKMIGLREIRDLLDGKMSMPQCVAAIQQATRRYAKRQLTWFRRQTNFQSLNLSVSKSRRSSNTDFATREDVGSRAGE